MIGPSTLLVEVDGRVLRFEAQRPLRIGRSIEADVVLSAGSVSRQHAELRPTPEGWLLADTGSQYGTFVNGQRITELRVTGPITVNCGPEPSAAFQLTPQAMAPPALDAPSQPPAAPPPYVPVAPPVGAVAPANPLPPGLDQTQIIAAPTMGGPGGYAPPRTGPDLLVVAEGREYRDRHPDHVTVGRQPDCGIVIADAACSRLHGQVSAVPGGWTYTNTSREGTFLEGRRVEREGFDERTALRLGHPVAGPELVLVPILSAEEEERRFARKRRRRALLVAGSVAAVLVLIAGTVVTSVLLSGDDGDTTAGPGDPTSETGLERLTTDELESAKEATVLLVGEAEDLENGGTAEYHGSGSILTETGLILTNAHVAQPTAPGLEEYYGPSTIGDPEFLLVALVDGRDDTSARPAFRARPVSVDGRADAAVVQIYATADGQELSESEVEDLDLPIMPLGDSDDLQSGDDVTVLGFPGISESTRLSVTTGVISTFIDRPDLGERSEIDTDARIAPGNSGGAAINNDAQIIGIPSSLFTPEGSPVVSGRIRPINVVLGLIEDAEN